MNNSKSKPGRKSLNSVGISSLLVIFVVLATVILSVLCLVTVRQDLDRAKKLSTEQEEYYNPPSAITFAKPIAITITTRSSDIRQAITITIIEHIKCSSFNIILFKALNSV